MTIQPSSHPACRIQQLYKIETFSVRDLENKNENTIIVYDPINYVK
jgi:hypothetical protein